MTSQGSHTEAWRCHPPVYFQKPPSLESKAFGEAILQHSLANLRSTVSQPKAPVGQEAGFRALEINRWMTSQGSHTEAWRCHPPVYFQKPPSLESKAFGEASLQHSLANLRSTVSQPKAPVSQEAGFRALEINRWMTSQGSHTEAWRCHPPVYFQKPPSLESKAFGEASLQHSLANLRSTVSQPKAPVGQEAGFRALEINR